MKWMFNGATSFGACLEWDISNVRDTTDLFTASNGGICTVELMNRPMLALCGALLGFSILFIIYVVYRKYFQKIPVDEGLPVMESVSPSDANYAGDDDRTCNAGRKYLQKNQSDRTCNAGRKNLQKNQSDRTCNAGRKTLQKNQSDRTCNTGM